MKRSFPVIRQHDSMQCGLACLSTICQFYGKPAVNDKIKCIGGKNYFCAYANISQNIIESAKLQKGINVQAAIVINNETITEIITAKIREKRGAVYTQEQKEKSD